MSVYTKTRTDTQHPTRLQDMLKNPHLDYNISFSVVRADTKHDDVMFEGGSKVAEDKKMNSSV